MAHSHTDFQPDIDLELEKAGFLAYFSEFLITGRPAPPMLTFWRGQKRVLSISCRPWEDERDKHKAIMEMLWMSPAIQSTTMVLAMVDPVKLMGRIARSVIIVTVTCHGALATVAPYDVNDEDSTIAFEEDPELDPNGGGAYSEIIRHMLPVFALQRKSLFSGPQIVQYLNTKGFETQFYGDENMQTISTYNF